MTRPTEQTVDPSAGHAPDPAPDPSGAHAFSPSAAQAPRRRARPAPLRPTGLTVLYDAQCAMCRRARWWVESHRLLLPVRFVPAGSQAAMNRFPQLDVGSTLADVTVITDDGAVLRGEPAWITVLWAVARTRPLAVKLAHGERRWMLRNAKGATETIRRLSKSNTGPATAIPTAANWPPPPSDRADRRDSACGDACRT